MNKIFQKIMNIALLFLMVATTLPLQPVAAAMVNNDINITENQSVIEKEINEEVEITEDIEQLENAIENQNNDKPIIFLGDKDLLYEKSINVISTLVSGGSIQMVRADGSSTVPTHSAILVYSLPDGRYVYCLEPNKVASSGSVSNNPSGNAFDSLSRQQKRILARTTAYGDLYGREDIMYRWAAQVLVWEAIGYRVTSYTGANMDTHLNILRDKVNKHNIIPSFSNINEFPEIQEHTLRWNTNSNRYEAILTDTNGVLGEKFAGMKSGTSGVYQFHDLGGNQVLITTDIHAENIWDVTPNSKSGMTFDPNPGYEPVFITSPTAQDLAGGLSDPINIKFRLRTEPALGTFSLTKIGDYDLNYNPNVSLSGVKFEVVDINGNVVENLTTNANGKAKSKLLLKGNYTVREIVSPNEYKPNPIIYNVTILPAQNVDLNGGNPVINIIKKGKATLLKEGQNLENGDNEFYPLQGAEFTIYHNGKELKTVVSDENGIVDTGVLIIGKYEIIETKAPNGYYWNRQYKEKFEIKNDGEIINLNYNQPLINELMRGGITLNKQGESLENDNDSIVDLEGTEFSLYKINNGKEKFVDKLITDKFGYAQKEALKPGDYVLRETKPTPGYIGDFEEYFTIEHNYQIITMNHGDEIQNQVIKGQAELFKIGESLTDTKDIVALKGVRFEVRDTKGKIVDTLTTDANGHIITRELKYGKYTIQEIETIDGYVLGGYKQTFEIKTNGEVIKLADLGILENKAIKGKAELTKVGEKYVDEELVALEGVEFTVYKDINKNGTIDENDIIADTITTDKDGYAITRELKIGNYLVKETKTLTGLATSEEIFNFEIKKDGEVIKINEGNAIENKAIRGSAVLYKVGENAENWQNELFPLKGAEFTLYNHKLHDTEIGKYYSDKDGEVLIENLPYGTYKLVETNPAKGYKLNGYEEIFSIKNNGELIELNDKLKLDNPIIKGRVELNKVNDEGTVLPGVRFEVRDTKGKIVDTLTTDKDGYALSKYLKYGSYTLVETKTIDEHILDNTIYSFDIIEDGKIVVINEGNAIINIKQILESTGFKTSLIAVLISLTVLIAMLYARKKLEEEI